MQLLLGRRFHLIRKKPLIFLSLSPLPLRRMQTIWKTSLKKCFYVEDSLGT